jgi:MFS family permease
VSAGQGRRLFLWALVASLCVTAAIAILTLLVAEFDDTAARILVTTTFLSLASLMSLPAGVLLDRGLAIPFAWTVIGLAAAAFAVAMGAVWVAEDTEWAWKLALTLGALAGAGAQAAATTARRRPDDGRPVVLLYVLSVFLGSTLAALIAAAGWQEVDDATYYRFLGAVAVAGVLASLLQPILRRIQRPAAGGRVELVLSLDRPAPKEAVDAALRELGDYGARVERSFGGSR